MAAEEGEDLLPKKPMEKAVGVAGAKKLPAKKGGVSGAFVPNPGSEDRKMTPSVGVRG